MSTPPTAPRSAEYAINHLKMYTDGSATSFHGCMTMPTRPVMSPPVRKEMRRGPEIGEVVGRADHVGGDVGGQRRQTQAEQGHDVHDWRVEAGDQLDGIPDCLAEYHDGARRYCHADEREEA